MNILEGVLYPDCQIMKEERLEQLVVLLPQESQTSIEITQEAQIYFFINALILIYLVYQGSLWCNNKYSITIFHTRNIFFIKRA